MSDITETEDGGESVLCVDPIPGYMVLKDGPFKDEARRAFIMDYLTDGEGCLLLNWTEHATKIEEFLKSGAPEKKPHLRQVK